MYAAAGGASLASRQARQRQRQQKKTQQLQAKLHPPKASVLSVAEHDASTPTRQSRQFHQLPTNYLRTPQAQARKLSASYTAQSKLLLPIDEGDTQSVLQMRMHTHTHAHMHHSHSHSHAAGHHSAAHLSHSHHQQQQHHHYHHGHGRVSPKLIHRHSGSSGTSFHYSHLPKSATATLPLVSQMEATPPMTPSGAVVAIKASAATSSLATAPTPPSTTTMDHDAISVPHHDTIIVTPATPMASPGHVAKQQYQDQERSSVDELPEAAAEKQPLTAAGAYDDGDDEPMEPPTGPLERKCSVYRMRRSDAFEHEKDFSGGGAGSAVRRQLKDLQFNNNQQQYEPLLTDSPQLVFKGLPNGRKWQPCAYCEEGICVCEHIECAQGRAAWLERGRRCSVQEAQQQAACHRRWVKRNRIQDASLGGSSDDEDFLGVLRGPSTFANAFLYVGLGTVALGLVIAFVGTGEKGFKTVELRLIGPSLIVLGLICCILRILFCICPSHCISSNKKTRKKNGNKVDADHTTSLLRGESKRVSIARGPIIQPKYPITHKRSNSKMLNEGMEALRQIATTSLFMQNEQKPSSLNRIVPIIKEPGNPIETPLEMKKLQTSLNVCEISDEEDEDDDNTTQKPTTRSTTKEMTETNVTTITAATIATTRNSAAQITNTTTICTTVSNERTPTLSSTSKLSRQRVAINKQQDHHQLLEQSQSLSSSSTVKDSVDDDLLMETSLMVIKTPPALIAEARPPNIPPQTSNSGSAVSTAGAVNSTGAIPRQTTKSSPSATATPLPPTYVGATSRLSSATQHIITYDLPSATPHTYGNVSGLPSSRSATERESLIRGPLGMPLSALSASSSTYTIPINPPLPAAVSTTNATATTISLLPLLGPSTTLLARTIAPAAVGITSTYTIPCNQHHPSIPGQVFSYAAPSTSYAGATANVSVRPHSAAATSTISDMATTSLSIFMPSSSSEIKSPQLPPSIQLQQSKTSAAQSVFASSSSFSFPTPLSSSSASSSASSNGRSMLIAATSTAPTATTTSFIGATLAPAPPLSNKFEPELLLSPAKLGQ